jgi:hypothetical protein
MKFGHLYLAVEPTLLGVLSPMAKSLQLAQTTAAEMALAFGTGTGTPKDGTNSNLTKTMTTLGE